MVLAACVAAIVHENHFFCFYQQNKGSESKVKFRQASNCFKRVLEAAPIAYATKTKESITPQKLGSQNFWRIVKSVLNKDKSAIPLLFKGQDLLSSAKQNCLLKTFLRTLILITRASLFCNSHMVKMVITSLDSSNASGLDCILVVVLKKL